MLANANINNTHIVSLQLAQDLFGFLFGFSLLLLNVDDGTGGAVGRVPRVLVHTCQTRKSLIYIAGCQNFDPIFLSKVNIQKRI